MLASNLSRDAFNRPAGTGLFSKWLEALRAWLLSSCPPGTKDHSCPRSVLKKELTKRPPFLVKSLVCKSSEKTVNGAGEMVGHSSLFSQLLLLANRHQFA